MSHASRSVPALVLLVLVACDPGAPTRPDSVILISLDTVRADHLGCYGSERETSPNLDAFAARGVLFERAISPAPWTLPAHASVLTGLYANRHGVRTRHDALGDDVPTLASALARHGFETGAFVNGLFLAESFGLAQGFGTYDLVPPDDSETGAAGAVTDAAMAWLDERRGRRVMLLVHYFDVHSNYRSRPRYERLFDARRDRVDGTTKQMLEVNQGKRSIGAAEAEDLARLYAAGIRQLDDEVARLFQKLSETGWLERSLVVVFSDHGEQFLEHGKLLHTRNHHRELLHVPLLLHGPSLPSGVRVAEPVSLVDIAPTVLSLLGIESTADLDGIDLQPFFREPAATGDRRPIFAEAGASIGTDTLRSVQDGRHKLIQDMSTGRQSLYDLLEDPGETRDVVGERRDVATALADRLERFADSRLVGGVAPEMPEEMREQLRALGYEE